MITYLVIGQRHDGDACGIRRNKKASVSRVLAQQQKIESIAKKYAMVKCAIVVLVRFFIVMK